METLFEHTLQRQVAAQTRELAEQSNKIGALEGKIDELTALMKSNALSSNTTNNSNNKTMNINNNNTTTINITPWGRSFYIPASMLEAVFAESETLQRYCHIGDKARTDPEEAMPYVQEALMDVIRRLHQDPQERNVYLNPKRSDQVLVYDETAWELRPLMEATRSLLDRAARGITTLVNKEWQKLSPKVANSAPWIPIMYDERREVYIVRTNPSIAAHLENIAPGRALPAPAARPADQLRGPKKEEKPPAAEEQKKAGPAPFTLYDAAALLRAAGLKAGEGWADSAKRLQAGSKGQEAGRIMSKLWEAMEEGLLSEAERMTVRELVTEYDAATMKRK